MTALERDNPSLKGLLPKDCARPGLDKQRLGRVCEYFLSQFADAEGKKGGQF